MSLAPVDPLARIERSFGGATFQSLRRQVDPLLEEMADRFRRDDLLTIQVDGTKGSAVAGLRDCVVQHDAFTPKPVWNPDIESPIDYFADWQQMPANQVYGNAFKAQWELFLKHVVADTPYSWTLLEGAKGVQLAELGLQSWRERRWVEVPVLEV